MMEADNAYEKNKNTYLIQAVCRSGYHAVTNWICSQLPGHTVFHNSCYFDADKKVLEPVHGIYNMQDPDLVDTGSEVVNVHNYVISVENHEFPYPDAYEYEPFKSAKDAVTIVVNRDPYNWLASLIQAGINECNMNAYSDAKKLINLWKENVRKSLNYDGFFIDVNFNEWFSDKEYRKDIADEIGFEFTDKGLEDVGYFGKGSSFSGITYDGKAQKMKVLERWKEFRDDVGYVELLDNEIHDLSDEYFGFSLRDMK